MNNKDEILNNLENAQAFLEQAQELTHTGSSLWYEIGIANDTVNDLIENIDSEEFVNE